MDEGSLQLDEPGARQLVLVRAIDEVDTLGKLLGPAEREDIERVALQASRGASPGGVDFGQYLQQRARRMLAAVENRNPRVAALREPEAWQRWLLVGLPIAACLFGAAIDRIDNPQRVNMLSPPLLGVLAWNLAMYLVLLAGALLPRKGPPPAGLHRWLSHLARGAPRTGRLQADVQARFHQHWLRTTGPAQAWWFKQLLHLAAAGWALGLAFSIVLGGLVREYRVGWESTLLGVDQVHAFLQALFAPVVLLLPFESFSVADLQRMAFSSAAPVGVEEARRWVWMYLALLVLLVILPRLALAAFAGWRRRRQSRVIRIDLRDPYFVQVLARVSPARITFSLVAAAGRAHDAVLRMLLQVSGRDAPADGAPWTVLSTARGDLLRLFTVPAGFQPPSAVVTAQAGGASPAHAWLQDLLGRFRAAPRPQERGDAAQATLADTDLMLLVADSPGDVRQAARLLHWVAQPVLVLASEDDPAIREEAQRLGLAADVLPLERSVAHWVADARLLDAAAARIATAKRAGFERLASTWKDRNAVRFGEAMRVLAAELVRAARDSEEVGLSPVGLRQLVSATDRDAAQRARDAARAALLQRVRAGEAALLAELVQLHRAGVPIAPVASSRMEHGFSEQQPVDGPQAGMAGAATGAAMGAGIDLLTGGLTLGAAAALGAVIGGGAGFVAAAWRNRGSPTGQPQVQIGDELLQTLAESLVLTYLAVAHRTHPGDAASSAWRSDVVAAVEARREPLAALWQQARQAPEAPSAVAPLAFELEDIVRRLLERL